MYRTHTISQHSLIVRAPLPPHPSGEDFSLSPSNLKPLTPEPAIEEIQTTLWLIKRHHMSTRMKSHKRKVAAALNRTRRPAAAAEFEIDEVDLVESLLAGPLERFGPGMVAEPVADEVRVTLSWEAHLLARLREQ